MTLMIFGGAGFIGSSIIQSQRIRENIVSFSSKKIEIFKNNKKRKVSYAGALKVLKKNKNIDIIFCAATRYDPKKYSNQPLTVFKNNIDAILKFIKILNHIKINKIILISSYAVYGDRLKKDNKENSIISPDNFSKKEFFYAFAKYIQEKLLINYCNKRKLKFNIIRLPSVYGPGSTLNIKNAHVIPSFIMQILKKLKKMKVYGTGNEKREFIYITDLIKIIMILRKNDKIGILNVGSNQFISIRNLLKNIIKGTNSSIKTIFNKESFSDVPLRKISYKKFNIYFKGYKFTKIDTGLNKTINWYKKKIND